MVRNRVRDVGDMVNLKMSKLEKAEREIIEYATLENMFKKLGKKTFDMWLNGFGEYTNEQLEILNLIKELNKKITLEKDNGDNGKRERNNKKNRQNKQNKRAEGTDNQKD